ncbi:MAG TPA: tetratricopeptide repeat protein [Tepidisphaeraceae bacterium]|jgi:tetratricopeptide (TPR) repeat protein|nr:tetratricopeptide repeat protein [Tepidisphaeraceae bacterium]
MNRTTFLLLTFMLAVLAALGGNLHAAPATTQEAAGEISAVIAQLGDTDANVRDAASRKLLSLGKAARPALREASHGDDPEIAGRAAQVLAEMRFGIDGDTPAALVDLVQDYRINEGTDRRQIIEKMSKLGWPGFRVMARLHRLEGDAASRRLLLGAMRTSSAAMLEDVWKLLMQGREDDAQEKLSQAAIGGDGASIRSYAALLLSRNKLADAIAEVLADVGPNPGADDAMLLAYLYRAKGEDDAALKSAALVPDGDLKPQARALERSIRIEHRQWPILLSQVTHDAQIAVDTPRALPRTTALVDKLSYARLAGDDKAFNEAFDAVRGLDFALTARDLIGNDLLLNDRVQEGIDFLVAGEDYHSAYVILMLQRREDDAAKVLRSAEESSDPDKIHVELFAARQFHALGEKSGEAIVDRVDKQIQDDPDEYWRDLVQTELALGQTDRAIERAAAALAAAEANPNAPDSQERVRNVMAGLVPPLAELAREWRVYFSQKTPSATRVQILKKIWMLFARKMPQAEAQAILRDAAPNPGDEPARRSIMYERNVVTAHEIGREDIMAQTLAAWAGDPDAARNDLGVLWGWLATRAALAKDYSNAHIYYGKAHARWPSDSIVWWMHGWTAIQAAPGDAKIEASAREEMRRASQCLMADDDRWINFLDALIEAGAERTGDAELQRAQYRRFGTPASHNYFESLRLTGSGLIYPDAAETNPRIYLPEPLGKDSAARFLQAADLSSISLLMLNRGRTVYRYPEGYILQPARFHAMRARGLIASGDIPAATKEMDLALLLTPANTELAAYIVPAFDQAGHATEANAVFNRVASVLQASLDRHPASPQLHSSLARMEAACDRRLDEALTHANRAVSLAPDNVEYLGTLAEVQFHRGQRQAAIETVKRGLKLDPAFADLQRQLKRFSQEKPTTRPG